MSGVARPGRLTYRRSGFDNRDVNEPALILVAQHLGAWCERNCGPFDWVVYATVGQHPCQWIPTEIKNPEGKNEFTVAQVEFMREADRRGAAYWIWRTEDDVIRDLARRAR